MSTVQFPDSQEVEGQAADWIAAIDRGLSNQEELELKQWLDLSPLHGEMLVKCASMFDLLDLLSPIAKLMPMVDEARKSDFQPRRIVAPKWAIAASLMITIISVWLVSNPAVNGDDSSSASHQLATQTPVQTNGVSTEQTFSSKVGEVLTVSLDDGSKLKLNTDSAISVKFSDSVRTVSLVRGEVFFDVATDASKPFIVEARSDLITVIGTAFSVDLSELATTEVLVAEGKVRVGRSLLSAPSSYPELFLTPGQKVIIRDDEPQVSDNNDTENQLAWRQGMLVFEGETLAQAIKEIDRYTPLSFKITDSEIANISVGGFFKTGDLEQLLLVLEQNFGVKSSQVGNEVLLSKALKSR